MKIIINPKQTMNFNSEIKEVESSKTKLVFVKVPDALRDLKVHNDKSELSGFLVDKTSFIDWFSPKLPEGNYQFFGYSHSLMEEDIETLFSSWSEFYRVCDTNEIYYSFSEYTGKWAVLIPII